MKDGLIWIFLSTSVFAFLSIYFWALQKRREREAYYRYELARQLIERMEQPDASRFLDWLKEEERIEDRRRRQGVLLGGLVLLSTGIGLLTMLGDEPSEWAGFGWIPLAIGLAMFVYLAIIRWLRSRG